MLDTDVIPKTLSAALRTGGDFAEIFAEDRRSTAANLDDGRVESVASSRDRGAGVRVVTGETTGFAYTADLSESSLAAAAEAAAAAAKGDGNPDRAIDVRESGRYDNIAETLPEIVAKGKKVGLLLEADEAARSEGHAIKQVSAGYADVRRKILVANSDGLLATDDVVRTRFGVSAVASGDTGMQTGYESLGVTHGFEVFEKTDVAEMARTASQRAITKLSARPAPSGSYPVVIKAGGGAVLFHEACGHPLEADGIQKGASVFCGKVGEMVAGAGVTLVDTATMPGQWGYYAIDDEGAPATRNVLISNGMLTDYMWDLLRARKEGRESSGNGRRQTYKHLPMVRMTNTFLENGGEDPDEIVRQTPYGVYCAQLGGGQVNPATGDFVFGMTEAYLIEDGQITVPLRQANLIGNGASVLLDIDAVANDFAMAKGGGMCGKYGQTAPVGMGQPTLRVSSLTIGGTAGA